MGMTAAEKKAFKKGFQVGVDSVEEGLPGWFGTFADMMTLLFAFFVLLAKMITLHSNHQFALDMDYLVALPV